MHSIEEYINLVNKTIAEIEYPKQPERLYNPIAYTMALGGKRLRPVLTLLTCEAMGGDIAKAIDVAVGIELFHNFTLLHDDVMDKADVRRGKPTVHRQWNDNVAILSGDAMLTMATQHIAKAAPAVLPQIMELFNRTAMEIYEGQQWDMDFEELFDVSPNDYIRMIRLKTSVLLGCACKAGAIIADASADDCQRLYDMGLNLGLAFQLQDDVLDVWGDEATFGKEIGGDIMNNKKTFLLTNAVQMATGDDANTLRRCLTDEYAIRDEKVAAVRSIFEKLNLKKLAETEIENYDQIAIDNLNQVSMSSEAHDMFTSFFAKLLHRQQ